MVHCRKESHTISYRSKMLHVLWYLQRHPAFARCPWSLGNFMFISLTFLSKCYITDAIVNNQCSSQQISNTDILYFWNHTHYPIVTNHKGFEAVRWVCNVGINGELMKEINEEIKRQGILIKTRILDGKKSWKLVSKR